MGICLLLLLRVTSNSVELARFVERPGASVCQCTSWPVSLKCASFLQYSSRFVTGQHVVCFSVRIYQQHLSLDSCVHLLPVLSSPPPLPPFLELPRVAASSVPASLIASSRPTSVTLPCPTCWWTQLLLRSWLSVTGPGGVWWHWLSATVCLHLA